MCSSADLDEFDLEIRAFGVYLDDLSRKIEPRTYLDSSSDASESEVGQETTVAATGGDQRPGTDDDDCVDNVTEDNGAPHESSVELKGVRATMDAIMALDSLTAPAKPLSPTLSPPPSFSRLPPDGHEFPPNYQDPGHFNVGVPAVIEMSLSPEPILKEAAPPPPLPASGPPPTARKFSEDLGPSRPRGVSNWRKDEKSECSVRDKIAMFSFAQDSPVRRASKGSQDDIFACEDPDSARKPPSRTPSYRSSLPPQPASVFGRKSSAVYNSMTDVSSNAALDNGEPPRSLDFNSRTQSSLDLTSSSSSAYSSSGSPDSSLSYGVGYSSTLPRKLGVARQAQSVSSKYPDPSEKPVTLSRATSFSGGSPLHTRSQSLVDIGSIPYTGKRNSVGTLGGARPGEDMRRASLNAMIEQRRRGISKLRGLVIPEKVAEVAPTQPIIDLPEIKSRDSILATKPPVVSHRDDQKSSHRRWSTSTDSVPDRSSAAHLISSPPWKSQSPAVNLPKYSPAFKRKSLAVCGAPSSASSVSSSLSSSREELRPLFDGSGTQKPPPPLPPSKPPRQFAGNFAPSYGSSHLSQPEPPKSLESITSPTRSDTSFEYVSSRGSSPDLRINAPVVIKDESAKKTNNGHVTNGNLYMNGSKINRLSPTGKLLSSENGRSEDDSDNDSAVSSSRSSISHGFSPPASPLPDNRTMAEDPQRHHSLHASILSPVNAGENRPLRRTLSSETTASIASSTTSTLTSGSQASCSSNGGSSSGRESKRVLKAQSVEAINRKNVLSSARYSSGKDYKIGSPLIQRKFEEDIEKQKLNDIHGNLQMSETILSHNGDDVSSKNSNSAEKLYEIATNVVVPPGSNANDPVHYKTTELEDVPNESSIIYFEVQETEVFDEPDTADNTVIEVTDKNKSVPLPAPRHSNNQTPVKSSSVVSVDEISVASDRWAELTKKYSKVQESKNDDVDRVTNATNQFLSKAAESEVMGDVYSDKNFKTKEFTLDLVNKTLVMSTKTDNKNEDDESSGDKSPTSPVGSYSSGKTIENSVSPPAVPPKPVQRRNVNNDSPLAGDKQESDLMTILTGKSRDQTPLQLRERRRSKDLDGLRPTSMTMERSISSEEVLPNGGLRTVKTIEHFQETVSSSTNKVPTAAMRHGSNRRSVSVNDIRKAFEKAELALANTGRANGAKTSSVITSSNGIANHHARVSSLDSTTSDDSYAAIPGYYGSVSTLQKEQFGSVTSIASSTSLISQQELQSLIDEANQVLEECGSCGSCPSPVYEVLVVVLHREMAGGSIGITLAGGADYESKEITVHKVLSGSPADKDGRIQKGDRILSINGKSMKGVTHREALNILKAPRTEVVLVVSRSRPDYDGVAPVEEVSAVSVRASLSTASSRPPRIPELPADTTANTQTDNVDAEISRGPPVVVTLLKDGAGLGFSLEGGKDSPVGDRALTVKKIFTGGCAEKNGALVAGDELLNVNGTDVTTMSRIEAWSLMKRLPDGNVSLTVRHKVTK